MEEMLIFFEVESGALDIDIVFNDERFTSSIVDCKEAGITTGTDIRAWYEGGDEGSQTTPHVYLWQV